MCMCPNLAFSEANETIINPSSITDLLVVDPRDGRLQAGGSNLNLDEFNLHNCPITRSKYPNGTPFSKMSENDQIACLFEISVALDDLSPSGRLSRINDLENRILGSVSILESTLKGDLRDIAFVSRFLGSDTIANKADYIEYYAAANRIASRNWRDEIEARIIDLLYEYADAHSEFTIWLQDTATQYRELTEEEKYYLQDTFSIGYNYSDSSVFRPILSYAEKDADGHFVRPTVNLTPGLTFKDAERVEFSRPGKSSAHTGNIVITASFPTRPVLGYKYNFREHPRQGGLIINSDDGWKRENRYFRSRPGERFCKIRLYEISNNHGTFESYDTSETEIRVTLYVEAATAGHVGPRHWIEVGADTAEYPPQIVGAGKPACSPDMPEVSTSLTLGQCNCVAVSSDWRPILLAEKKVCGAAACVTFCADQADDSIPIYSSTVSCR